MVQSSNKSNPMLPSSNNKFQLNDKLTTLITIHKASQTVLKYYKHILINTNSTTTAQRHGHSSLGLGARDRHGIRLGIGFVGNGLGHRCPLGCKSVT
jgi:hypothetical protein